MDNLEKESNEIINNKEDKKIKKILIKYLISESILLLVLIITLINFSRIQMFGKIVGSFANVFEDLGIILFFISLFTAFIFFGGMLIYVLIMHLKNNEWKELLEKIDKKTDIVSFIFEVFAIILFIMIYLFTPCTIKGDSMNPTFLSGQNVICANYMASSPKKDDIVVFDARNDNFLIEDVFFIKRIVATPGSKIKYDIDNYKLYVDDKDVGNFAKNYADGKEKFDAINQSINKKDDTASDYYEYIVPAKKYLVFGDNRGNSKDSRYFGYINKNQIFGKVTMRIFPLDKMKIY